MLLTSSCPGKKLLVPDVPVRTKDLPSWVSIVPADASKSAMVASPSTMNDRFSAASSPAGVSPTGTAVGADPGVVVEIADELCTEPLWLAEDGFLEDIPSPVGCAATASTSEVDIALMPCGSMPFELIPLLSAT